MECKITNNICKKRRDKNNDKTKTNVWKCATIVKKEYYTGLGAA